MITIRMMQVMFFLVILSFGFNAHSDPLPVDQDTISLWNFDSDTQVKIVDSAPAPIDGTTVDTALGQIPGIDPSFGRSRQFVLGSSKVNFGVITGSKLNFAGFNELSLEFIIYPKVFMTRQATIFSNGQFVVRLIDGFVAAYVMQAKGLTGLISSRKLELDTPYRIMVVFDNGFLGIRIDGEYSDSIDVGDDSILITHQNNEPIVIGGYFIGMLDDIRISDVARADVIPPYVELTSPASDAIINDSNPVFEFTFSDDDSGVDLTAIKVFLNGAEQSSFTITPTGVSGHMDTPLANGKNEIEIVVQDNSKNRTVLPVSIYYYPSNLENLALDVKTNHRFSCAIMLDRKVMCWGYNHFYELGNPETNMISTKPMEVQGIDNIQKLEVGSEYACAIDDEEKLYCWGLWYSEDGFPRDMDIQGVSDVKIGQSHTCVIGGEDDLWCWGYNQYGQVGVGHTDDVDEPTQILENVKAVSLGDYHTCALKDDGKVMCWGKLLGCDNCSPQPSPFEMDDLENAVSISVGEKHACSVLSDGSAKCWGSNVHNALGNIDLTGATSTSVVIVNIIDKMKEILPGSGFTCAVMLDDKVKCWGLNDDGQLGNETYVNSSNEAVTVIGLENVKQLSIGHAEVCSVLEAGELKCWGRNEFGQLGDGSFENSAIPKDVVFNGENKELYFTDIQAGWGHTCGTVNDGSVRCWGEATQGQLGNPDDNNASAFSMKVHDGQWSPVKGTEYLEVDTISSGKEHSCGLTSGGLVKCWGNSDWGQLGHSSMPPHNLFYKYAVHIEELTNVSGVSSGNRYSCAVLNSGKIKCWGEQLHYKLGNGKGTGITCVPTEVQGIDNAKIVETADEGNHTCAILNDGKVKCWGNNQFGQVGNENVGKITKIPTEVVELESVVSISLGLNFSCALLENGKVKCWGKNNLGQLGNGGNLLSYKPYEVSILKNVVKLDSNNEHSCAVISDGSVKCWGDNREMQLGNGGFSPSSIPTTVINIDNAVSIGAAAYHTCALLENRKTVCWGNNTASQLGDLQYWDHNSPRPMFVSF